MIADTRQVGGISPRRLARIEGWGMLDRTASYAYPVDSEDDARELFDLARAAGRPIVPRGSGYSYGDAAILAEGLCADFRGMNRILEWDPERGIVRVEPGVTVRELWRAVLPDGWWPPVVPGAMMPTLGGCLAVNAHGKNDWRMGTLGEHVLDLEVLTPRGDRVRLSPTLEPELFHAQISGMGMLGMLLSARLRMGRVRSGLLNVEHLAVRDLQGMFHALDEHAGGAHYMVGWIDGFARGSSLGRGLVQVATHLGAEDPKSMSVRVQDPPERVLGVVPRSELWRALRLTVNDPAMQALNLARFQSGKLLARRTTVVPHAQFQFFHDYVPGWKRAWQPGGILQYQVFAPAENARDLFGRLLGEAQREGMPPYLAVFKLHRSDSQFLLSYNPDGYSLSLDFHATDNTRDRLANVLRRWTDDFVLPAGGRFYPAKDSVLTADQARRMYGTERYDRFRALKSKIDPDGLLQSELYRRLFA